jgi:hypothetical protein
MDRHSQQLVLGVFFLAIAAMEAGTGTAFGARLPGGFRLVRRKDEPRAFWLAAILTALVGVFGLWAGLNKIS